MYSFHSSLEEKNQLLFTLTQYGIETTVDRSRKKDRIREWIQSSAITEEDNEDDDSDDDEDLGDDVINTMRGKHFPESKIENDNKKQPGYATPKPIERKNPFAPKVAKERQEIAKSANFPNGDPNLGIKRIDDDTKVDATRSKSPTVPVRKHRSHTATLPTDREATVRSSKQHRRSKTTVLPAAPTTQITNPLTMSVASQLVMQSFNSLQAMNVALPVIPTVPVPVPVPVPEPEPEDVEGKRELNVVDKPDRISYGKDAYEHYGITQGVAVKVVAEGVNHRHRGSSGSGSRSVSN